MRFGRRGLRRCISLVVVLPAALATVGLGSAGAANRTVTVRDNVFVPSKVAVKPGESVTWSNPGPTGQSSNAHNVHFDDGTYSQPAIALQGPWSVARTFSTNGTHSYHCHEHVGSGMTGVVVVNDLGTFPPVPTLSVFPNPAVTGQTVNFDATASKDDDGTIAKFEWDLDGNGTFERNTGTNSTTTQTYASPATLTVKVRVTDNETASAEKTSSLRINAAGS